MRVVVTGGGGYVGYHIGWALSRTGHDVALLDLVAPDPEWEETAPHALHDALPDGQCCRVLKCEVLMISREMVMLSRPG